MCGGVCGVEAHEAQAAAARAAAKTAAAAAAAEAEADARVAAAAAEVRALRQRVALLEAQGEPSRRAAHGGEAEAERVKRRAARPPRLPSEGRSPPAHGIPCARATRKESGRSIRLLTGRRAR